MKYSFSILKPDCLERNMKDFVFSFLEKHGFTVLLEKRMRLSLNDVEFIYERCVNEDFFRDFATFLVSGDVIAVIVKNPETSDAVKELNSLVGHTNPSFAKSGTIRKFGESIRRNLIHSSADVASFWRETSRVFSKEEMNNAGL